MKQKILHLAQFIGVGGLEKILLLLIKEQMKAGHEVELIVYDHEQSWVEYFRSQGIKVNSDFRKNEGYDFGLLKWLARQIKDRDVVHTHDLNPLMYIAPLKLIFRLQDQIFPRLIHTAHGMDHINHRPVSRIYEKFCSLMTDATVAVSPGVKESYLKEVLADWSQLFTIMNGTEIPGLTYSRKEYRQKLVERFHLNPAAHIWTCVARVVPLKNQHLLIEAAAHCPDIELLLVGPSGDDNYWSDLQRKKGQNVHFVGAQSDVHEILAGSDFYVSASRHEGIPVSILEAGACGLPCLLSYIPGHRVLQHHRTDAVAEFFHVNKLQDLIEKMRKMQKHREASRLLGLNLNLHVRENFSSSRMQQEYQRIYTGDL